MSDKTANYQLTKLDSREISSVIDLNSNADKVDVALKQNRDAQKLHCEDKTNPHGVTKAQIGLGNVDNTADLEKPISSIQQNALNRKADLSSDGKVPASQLPSYVDEVLEYANKEDFPAKGEAGKIYINLKTNLTYRWSGSAYVEISPSLVLGETASTAYRGDKGRENADAITNIKTTLANLLDEETVSMAEEAGVTLSGNVIETLNRIEQLLLTNPIIKEYDGPNAWHVRKYANGYCELTNKDYWTRALMQAGAVWRTDVIQAGSLPFAVMDAYVDVDVSGATAPWASDKRIIGNNVRFIILDVGPYSGRFDTVIKVTGRWK